MLVLSLTVTLATVSPAHAVTPSQSVAAKRAAFEKAASEHAALESHLEAVEARLAQTSADLDELIQQQAKAEQRLSSRASNLYRAGQIGFVSVLMMADTFEGFSARWALLTRITAQDAAAVRDVKRARKRAVRKARELMTLQEDAASRMRAATAARVKARNDLAKSQAEYQAYQARVRAIRTASAPRAKPRPLTNRKGSGDWATAVASHYGRNFTGRGADGTRIGPNSMIVAHKTLPFGTLVEFRYNGKTAVARVSDRGPYTSGRTWDLGPGIIRILGFNGVHKVKYRIIGR